jgi:enoyl-CoA hydratase/carnithine racemase
MTDTQPPEVVAGREAAVSVNAAAGIGRITLDRPELMNAVNVELGVELERAILVLGSDPTIHVIVIRGAGGNFCAGGDFAEVERLRADGPSALRTLFVAFRRACDAIAAIDVPVVAAVEGVATAGGFELMQAADVVLVSDDARISDNHIRFGMIPGGGSTQRLPRLIGRQQAMGVLLSGDRLSGADAARLGLAYRSFPRDRFDDEIELFVSAMAGRDRGALTAIKHLVTSGLGKPVAAGLDDEITAVVSHISEGAGRNGASVFSERGGTR